MANAVQVNYMVYISDRGVCDTEPPNREGFVDDRGALLILLTLLSLSQISGKERREEKSSLLSFADEIFILSFGL